MNEEQLKLKEKVDNFFEKKEVALEDRYFVCKALSEEYWQYILNDDVSDDDVDEFEEQEEQEEDDLPGEEEDDLPPDEDEEKEHSKGIASKIKKPLVKIKK